MSASVYTPLWCKSNYSFLEGASFPEQYVGRASELGLKAIALTDRDGIYGIVKAHLAALEHDVHLIIGSQLTISQPCLSPCSLLLLVKNQTGYANLCRLITLGRRRCEKVKVRLPSMSAANMPAGCMRYGYRKVPRSCMENNP